MALLIKARALLAIVGGSASKDIERCGGSSVKAKKLPPKREQWFKILLTQTGLSNYSDTDSTAASAKDTKAPRSNRVMQTPTQKIIVTAERTSTFMVVALCNIIFGKNNSPYVNHKTARGCDVSK